MNRRIRFDTIWIVFCYVTRSTIRKKLSRRDEEQQSNRTSSSSFGFASPCSWRSMGVGLCAVLVAAEKKDSRRQIFGDAAPLHLKTDDGQTLWFKIKSLPSSRRIFLGDLRASLVSVPTTEPELPPCPSPIGIYHCHPICPRCCVASCRPEISSIDCL